MYWANGDLAGRSMLKRDDASLEPDDLILDPGTPLNSAYAFLELKYFPEWRSNVASP